MADKKKIKPHDFRVLIGNLLCCLILMLSVASWVAINIFDPSESKTEMAEKTHLIATHEVSDKSSSNPDQEKVVLTQGETISAPDEPQGEADYINYDLNSYPEKLDTTDNDLSVVHEHDVSAQSRKVVDLTSKLDAYGGTPLSQQGTTVLTLDEDLTLVHPILDSEMHSVCIFHCN